MLSFLCIYLLQKLAFGLISVFRYNGEGDSPMYTLGINAVYHDSSACLVHDGRVIAAAEEERFTHQIDLSISIT
jgi:hypothetical protein